MPKSTQTLPPEIAKWLASKNPALVEKAEAALRDVEPDANDLLFKQVEREQRRTALMYLLALGLAQQPMQMILRHKQGISVSLFCLCLMVSLPCIFLSFRYLSLPAANRFNAVVTALAKRGDLRAVPFLMRLPSLQKELLMLLQNAPIGETTFAEGGIPKANAAVLQTKFSHLTVKQKGAFSFKPAATATPQKVGLWLALLPHLAAQTDAKSRAVLRRVADVRTSTLDEELIQQTARALLNPSVSEALSAQKADETEAATVPQTPTWVPAATDETPAQVQRLRRL